MTTGSNATHAGLPRAPSTDPEAHEQEQAERRVEAPTDAPPVHEVGTEDSISFASIWQLFGYTILDASGTNIGSVGRVWTDTPSGRLSFVGLTTGWVRRQTHVIPARDARIDDNDRSIRVPYPGGTIRHAPHHNTDVSLTSDQERKVDTYYDNS